MLLVVDRLFLCSCMGVLGCCCGIAMHVMRCSELFNVFLFFLHVANLQYSCWDICKGVVSCVLSLYTVARVFWVVGMMFLSSC